MTNVGSFTFPVPVLPGSSCSVAIDSQPSGPGLSTSCEIAPGTNSSTVTNAEITSIAVHCSDSQAPHITDAATDPTGTIYCTANGGTPGSEAIRYVCRAPFVGDAYSCAAVAGSPIAVGKLLTYIATGYLLEASIPPAGAQIFRFPADQGPTAPNLQLIYTSNGAPVDVNAQKPVNSIAWPPTGQPPALVDARYVMETAGASAFGSGVHAYARIVPCMSGTQFEIMQGLLAMDSARQLHSARELTCQGQSIAPSLLSGYSFSGDENPDNHTSFSCSRRLPSARRAPATGMLTPQVLAITPTCEPYSSGITTCCGSFAATLLFDIGTISMLLGTFWFTRTAYRSSYSGTIALGTLLIAPYCQGVMLGAVPMRPFSCSGTHDIATAAVQFSGSDMSFNGEASATMVSGTALRQ